MRSSTIIEDCARDIYLDKTCPCDNCPALFFKIQNLLDKFSWWWKCVFWTFPLNPKVLCTIPPPPKDLNLNLFKFCF